MDVSFLYHGFGLRTVECSRTEYKGNGIVFLFSPLGHPRLQAPPLMRLHSACCSSLIPSITLWDKDDFGET